MKVAILILHIFCAVLFGISAIIQENIVREIFNTLACMCWSICVGADIIWINDN